MAMDVAFTRGPHALTTRPTQKCAYLRKPPRQTTRPTTTQKCAYLRQPPRQKVPSTQTCYFHRWLRRSLLPCRPLQKARYYYPRFRAGVDACAHAHVARRCPVRECNVIHLYFRNKCNEPQMYPDKPVLRYTCSRIQVRAVVIINIRNHLLHISYLYCPGTMDPSAAVIQGFGREKGVLVPAM